MGSEGRAQLRDSGVPGPGSYTGDVEKGKGPSWVMGTSKRADMKGSDAPGPGGYNPRRSPDGPLYSMAGKQLDSRRHDSPGPGQYNPDNEKVKQSAPGYKIGTESKGYKDMTSRKDVPGPGQYDQKNQKDTPAYGFGSAQREKLRDTGNPGPGAYA